MSDFISKNVDEISTKIMDMVLISLKNSKLHINSQKKFYKTNNITVSFIKEDKYVYFDVDYMVFVLHKGEEFGYNKFFEANLNNNNIKILTYINDKAFNEDDYKKLGEEIEYETKKYKSNEHLTIVNKANMLLSSRNDDKEIIGNAVRLLFSDCQNNIVNNFYKTLVNEHNFGSKIEKIDDALPYCAEYNRFIHNKDKFSTEKYIRLIETLFNYHIDEFNFIMDKELKRFKMKCLFAYLKYVDEPYYVPMFCVDEMWTLEISDENELYYGNLGIEHKNNYDFVYR